MNEEGSGLPPDIPPDNLLDGSSYTRRLEYFRKKSEKARVTDTFLFVGHGCRLKVSSKALHFQQGSVRGEKHEPVLLYPGLHTIKQIIFLSPSGFVTLDALRWCRNQGISLLMLDELGHLLYSIAPGRASAAQLRRLQYQASMNDRRVAIARELVKQKTEAQIAVLKTIPSHTVVEGRVLLIDGRRVTIRGGGIFNYGDFIWKHLEHGLTVLEGLNTIVAIMGLEGRLAANYWNAFVGIPIAWRSKKDRDSIPPHWKYITQRWSPISYSSVGPRATNPFHAALNYMYAVTEHQLLGALHGEGLDPACGFLHNELVSSMSLVYDLVEPLRALVDAEVLAFFRKETFRRGDFTIGSDGRVLFNPELLRFLVASCTLDDAISGGIVSWFKDWLLSSETQSS